MSDAIGQLFEILRSIGATPRLYGKPITEVDAREIGARCFVDRIVGVRSRLVVPRGAEWSPY